MIAEQKYIKNTTAERRKKFAQFFTPKPIALLMANWLLGNQQLKTLLEPAFGLGIFSRLILQKNKEVSITGFDIDPLILKEAQKNLPQNNKLNLHAEDYLFNDWNNKYDGIICNPPYFKFHDYENKNALKEIKKHLKIHLSGFTNIHTLFLLKSIHQLKNNGRIAYIIPSEFLNADYGKHIKQYLLNSKTLRHIFIIDFKENVFDDALTTSAILLLAKDEFHKHIHFSNIKNVNDLKEAEKIINGYPHSKGHHTIPTHTIKSSIKWRQYYQSLASSKFKHLIPFNQVAKVVRGIATGANGYFVFNKQKAEAPHIKRKNLLPCITRSKDIHSPFFTSKDYQKLANDNANVFLFDGTHSPDKHVKKYIRHGEEQNIHKRYLTSKRKPWYAIENRPPAPILAGVFNRNGLKFVRNEAMVRNLTTFHCIYPCNDLFNKLNINLLFAYLLTDVAKEIFDDNRREYGNGLKKFEPNDLNNAQMLDLAQLSAGDSGKILNWFQKYRTSVLEEKEDIKFIENIDQLLRKKYLQ